MKIRVDVVPANCSWSGARTILEAIRAAEDHEVAGRPATVVVDGAPFWRNAEAACPECGAAGPHDDNGQRWSGRAYCCAECGAHFDACMDPGTKRFATTHS